MTHGDGFAPYPALEPYANRLEDVFFYEAGPTDAPSAVVLIHGNGDEADSWRHVIGALARRFRVVAPDLPGFGRSAPRPPGDLDALASGVLDLIEGRGPARVSLVGSSLGAVVACAVAQAMPGGVDRLVLSGGASPGLGEVGANPALRSLLTPGVGEAFYNGLRDQGEDAAFATLAPYYADLGALPEPDRAFLRGRVWARVWSDTQRAAFFAAMRSLFDPSGRSFVAGLGGVPTLLVWGERDAIMPLPTAHALLSKLPNARLEVIAGSGHLPHQERPEAFLRAIEPFLAPGAGA